MSCLKFESYWNLRKKGLAVNQLLFQNADTSENLIFRTLVSVDEAISYIIGLKAFCIQQVEA